MTKHCEDPHKEWKYRLWYGISEDKRKKKNVIGDDKSEDWILDYQFFYTIFILIGMIVGLAAYNENNEQWGIFIWMLAIILFIILNIHSIYFYGLKTGWHFGFGVIIFFVVIGVIVGFFLGIWLLAGALV